LLASRAETVDVLRWKGQADVRRSIEQLCVHRHMVTDRPLARAPYSRM
jgi:hypothetical protein